MQLTLEFTKKDLEGRGLAPQGGASALGVCKVGWCPQLTRGEAAVLVERSLLGGRLSCRVLRCEDLTSGGSPALGSFPRKGATPGSYLPTLGQSA